VELGFISNPAEEKFLQSEEGQTYMASAIYRAFKQYKKEFEMENKPMEQERQVKDRDLDYRIQFYADRVMVPLSDPRFKDIKEPEMYRQDGLYKYTSGHFVTFEDARSQLSEIRTAGFTDAFVVAFSEGKRIPVNEARALEAASRKR
jgi:N-acetylmuramoyl-L-alanine amidase